MTDTYTRFIRSAPGSLLAKQTGLPRPSRLPRRGDRPEVLGRVVVLGESPGAEQLARLLLAEGHDVRRRFEELRSVGSVIAVLDEVASPADLGPILLPLSSAMRSLAPGSRVVTISRPATGADPAQDAARGGVERRKPSTPPRAASGADPAQDAARGGVEGFLRSLAHEMRGG